MRESIGGTWILSIVMTFLMLFTAYLAVSVNYAKAFRIKNSIISKIETMNIPDGSSSLDVLIQEGPGTLSGEINAYLTSQAYVVRGKCSKINDHPGFTLAKKIACDSSDDDLCGVCIFEREAAGLDDYDGGEKHYYTVVDFFKFDIPLLGDFITFKVKGDSKAV